MRNVAHAPHFEGSSRPRRGAGIALVDPDNREVIGLDLRLGFEPVQMMYAFRIRQWHAMSYGSLSQRAQLQEWMGRLVTETRQARAGGIPRS